MSYLARLKSKIAEKPLQRELPKLPKGASVSFGSSRRGLFGDFRVDLVAPGRLAVRSCRLRLRGRAIRTRERKRYRCA